MKHDPQPKNTPVVEAEAEAPSKGKTAGAASKTLTTGTKVTGPASVVAKLK